jgi:hypothetical protein
MKTLLKIVGGIVVLLILVLVVLSITGFEPKARRPGLWIKGDLVTTPVSDWSYTNKIRTIEVQTNTWYLVPHSVTTFCIFYNGQLYLASIVPPGGAKYPGGRIWDQMVARDPHVRLKIGNQLFDRTLQYVTDPVEHDGVIDAQTKKYPDYKVAAGSTFNVFHVLSN